MSPALLAALKASLADPAKGWAAIGVSPDEDGSSTVQLQSLTLGLTIVVTREAVWPEFKLRFFVNGFAYSAQDEELADLIEAMAVPALIGAEADLIAYLSSDVGLAATGIASAVSLGVPVLFGPDGLVCS
jgi:hypothetical protein